MAPPVSAENPYGLAVVTRVDAGRSEAEAARDFDWSTQRAWKVVNPSKVRTGSAPTWPTSWCPAAAFPPMMDPSTPQYLRAPVIGHTLWVTRHHDDERWPAATTRRSRPWTPG